jgi:hypothetical protein
MNVAQFFIFDATWKAHEAVARASRLVREARTAATPIDARLKLELALVYCRQARVYADLRDMWTELQYPARA